MANAVAQWTIDQLWSGLQQIANGFKAVSDDLNADKAKLTALWSATKADANAARRADNQRLLTPLIHQNSVLRVSYLGPIRDKYNQAVQIAADALKKAGYATPGLSGMGFVFAIAPVAAVTLVVVALSLLEAVNLLTYAQRRHTDAVAQLMADPNTTPEQKIALLAAMDRDNKSAGKANAPGGFQLGDVTPILIGVAVLVALPTVLQLVRSRRAAT